MLDVGIGTGHLGPCTWGMDVNCTNTIANGALANDLELYMAPRANTLDPVLLADNT